MMSTVIENEEVAAATKVSIITPVIRSMLARSKSAMQRRQTDKVLACSIYGSHLRGYADMTSDNDVIFLMRRHNYSYLGLTNMEVSGNRAETDAMGKVLSEELGFRISVDFIDEATLLVGLMRNTARAVSVYQTLESDSKYVREHYKPIYEKYFNAAACAGGMMKAAAAQIRKANATDKHFAYRIERNYLTALWNILRSLRYISEHTNNTPIGHNEQIKNLISSVGGEFGEFVPMLTDPAIYKPYYNRTNREPGGDIEEVTAIQLEMLETLHSQSMRVFSEFAGRCMPLIPTMEEQAQELLALLVRNQECFND